MKQRSSLPVLYAINIVCANSPDRKMRVQCLVDRQHRLRQRKSLGQQRHVRSKQLILILRIIVHVVGQRQVHLQQIRTAHAAQVGQLVLQAGQRRVLELADARIIVANDQALEAELVRLTVRQIVGGRLQRKLHTVTGQNQRLVVPIARTGKAADNML